MKRLVFFILILFPIFLFSQTVDIRIPVSGGSVGNADSLGSKAAIAYLLKADSTLYATLYYVNDTLSHYVLAKDSGIVFITPKNLSDTLPYYLDTATTQSAYNKIFKGNTVLATDLLPDSTGLRNIGSQTLRIKKLWTGGGSISMQDTTVYGDTIEQIITLDDIDGGITLGSRIHVHNENKKSAAICLHPDSLMPEVNPNGYRIWADSSINRPKWLLPNTDTSQKFNYTFVMEDTAGNVEINTIIGDSAYFEKLATGDSTLWIGDGKLHNTNDTLFWNGIDLTSAGTTIEFTSDFDNNLITKYSGAGTVVYDIIDSLNLEISLTRKW